MLYSGPTGHAYTQTHIHTHMNTHTLSGAAKIIPTSLWRASIQKLTQQNATSEETDAHLTFHSEFVGVLHLL